jgi:hypothetical protein
MDERQLRHAHANHIMALRNFEFLMLSGEVSLESDDGQAVLAEYRDAVVFLEKILDYEISGDQ